MNFLYKLFIKNKDDLNNPKVVKKYGVLAGIVGVILNIFLFVIKIVISIISGSVSIISDAFNNLSDASSSIITIIGFKLSSKPADKKHPYGHGREEYVSAFIISFIILFIGIELGISSVNKIINPSVVDFSYVMLIVLSITVLVKLWMAIFYNKTSKKINSLTLKASSKDSLNDVIATFIVIVGLLIGELFNINLDGYLGLAVCLYILFSAILLIKETIDKLIGGTPNIELIEKIKKEILDNNKILGIHDVLYHYYGLNKIYMSLDAEVDSSMSLIDAHDLVDSIEENIKSKYGVELIIHVDPILLDDIEFNKIKRVLNEIICKISNKLSFHDLKIINKKSKSVINFDLLVPFDFELENEEIYNLIVKEIKSFDDNYKVSITFDNI